MKLNKHYCYCPVCNKSDKVPDFYAKADSLAQAKELLVAHEKECHKKKPVGTFGSGVNYPKALQ